MSNGRSASVKRTVAGAVALFLVSGIAGLDAQVGHPPESSPYRPLRAKRVISVGGGYLWGSSGKAKVGKLDTDANRDSALKYSINAIPTLMLFKNGEATKTFVGITSKDDLAAALNDAASA